MGFFGIPGLKLQDLLSPPSPLQQGSRNVARNERWSETALFLRGRGSKIGRSGVAARRLLLLVVITRSL